jgi:hypothetical protein
MGDRHAQRGAPPGLSATLRAIEPIAVAKKPESVG